ncbi:MAG: protein kinase domain-containing protein [Acidobacteriota bacterium]
MDTGTRVGPYEITGRVGAGGMGEVYRARDTRLGRDVAIKVLPAEVANDPDRVARFEREARALASLSHPGILAIHDCGREGVVTYAVTELLEGETLRARLRRERLPWRKAVDVGAAIADGLAAAHEKGIVHRDLKPENVFLTAGGRVKILDFGLARITGSSLSQRDTVTSPPPGTLAGAVLGTVGYMAPEQVRGEPADARSDIFALGCLLYEMLSGERAFERGTAAETMAAILREPVPEVASSGVEVVPELNRIVAHCLEKQPGERFQSASDAAFALRSLSTGGTGTVQVPARRFDRRVLFSTAAVVVVASAAALSLWRPWRPGAPAADLEPRRIVVAVFENRTGDATLDPLGRMASDWVTQGLSRIDGLDVVPSTARLFAPSAVGVARAPEGDPLRALAGQTGAGTLVSGAYYLYGDVLQFQATVTDAAGARVIRALDPVSGRADAPMEAIESLRQQVMGAVAANLDAVHDLGAQDRPPRYEAYAEFIAGFELFGTDAAGALRHFESAARLDPDFLVPLLWAAYMHHAAGNFERSRAILAGLDVKREQLTPLGRGWLDALVGYTGHRYFEALQALRVAEQRAPRDPLVNQWMSVLAYWCNRPREAVATYDRLSLQPWPGRPIGAAVILRLGEALHLLGEHRRELEEIRRNHAAYPELLRSGEVMALAALGRVAELEAVIEEGLTVHDRMGDTGEIMLEAAEELRAHGRRAESIALAARAAEWYRSRTAREIAQDEAQRRLAKSLYRAERWSECRSAVERLDDRSAKEILPMGMLGVLAARAGDRGRAERIGVQLDALDGPYVFGTNTLWRSRIAAQLGDRAQALALLREAFGEGLAHGVWIHRDIDLEPLRDDPAFLELIRPKG